MRKLLVVVAVLALPGMALAQTIIDSPHDLSSGSTASVASAGQQSQVCWYCHVPHNARITRAVWNRAATTENFGTWGAGWTNTIAGTTLPTGVLPGEGSRRCFSCHDGTSLIGNVFYGTDVTDLTNTAAGAMDPARGSVVDPGNMANNHPVSVPYPPVADNPAGTYQGNTTGVTDTTDWQTIANAEAAGVIFYQDAGLTNGVECASCHDPHAYGAGYVFTHALIDCSAICIACHNK